MGLGSVLRGLGGLGAEKGSPPPALADLPLLEQLVLDAPLDTSDSVKICALPCYSQTTGLHPGPALQPRSHRATSAESKGAAGGLGPAQSDSTQHEARVGPTSTLKLP